MAAEGAMANTVTSWPQVSVTGLFGLQWVSSSLFDTSSYATLDGKQAALVLQNTQAEGTVGGILQASYTYTLFARVGRNIGGGPLPTVTIRVITTADDTELASLVFPAGTITAGTFATQQVDFTGAGHLDESVSIVVSTGSGSGLSYIDIIDIFTKSVEPPTLQ